MFKIKKSNTFLSVTALLLYSMEAVGNTLDTIRYQQADSYVHLVSGFTTDQEQIILDKTNLNFYLVGLTTLVIGLLLWSWWYHFTSHQKMKTLNLELQEYIESNIKLEQFAHIASHDLKSPLRTVISYAGLLKMKLEGQSNPDIDRYLAYIQNGAVQMDNLTSDLLDFAKINAMELNKERFKTREMIQDVIDILEHSIKSKKAEIIISNLPEYLWGDRQKLQRVIHNLLSNSLKFTRADNTPKIKITCRQMGTDFIFSISDNGIGIDKKFHKSIFKTFAKLNTESDFKGSGLGLSMADTIIEHHNGSMKLKSIAGEGSTFYFKLPREGEEIAYDAKKELVA